MKSLRKLVLGETWTLPLGVALAVGAGAALEALSDGASWWRRGGGAVLVVLVVGALALSVASSARR